VTSFDCFKKKKTGLAMKEKIVKIEKGKEGVALPEEFLRFLELIPGAEVEVRLDKKRKWIVIRPMHGEDFIEHFRDTMESMA
jgi:antitoxin component of MazEF toxin-antitoxin module